jgi:hypothetical protein
MPKKFLPRVLIIALLLALYFFTRNAHRFQDNNRSFSTPTELKPAPPRDLGKDNLQPGEDFVMSCSSEYFAGWQEPVADSCQVQIKNGFPVPDPHCTPGGANPSISVGILRSTTFRTREIRNCESSEAAKHIAYRWYGIQKPRVNSNQNQLCELDHLVPLELGGADGLGNIWPECGLDGVPLNERYFKVKDQIENYLADSVKSGRMPLDAAQRGIASDWTQYIAVAKEWCAERERC